VERFRPRDPLVLISITQNKHTVQSLLWFTHLGASSVVFRHNAPTDQTTLNPNP